MDARAVTQDRIEDILNAYTDPVPRIRWHGAGWAGGLVGMLEVLRDPADIRTESSGHGFLERQRECPKGGSGTGPLSDDDPLAWYVA